MKKKITIEKIHQPFSNLFNAYTKAINKKHNREGSLFKVCFKRERINTENYLRNVIVYTHLNPVKHNFQDNYFDYKYSSFQSILSEKPTLLLRNEVIELFGNKKKFYTNIMKFSEKVIMKILIKIENIIIIQNLKGFKNL